MFRPIEATPPWIPPTECLTPSAQQALSIAESESLRLKQDYIGAEHLLLGIVSLDEGNACASLKAQGMTLEKLLADAQYHHGAGRKPPRFTPTMMKIIPLSIEKAKALGEELASPERLLDAIIDEGQNIAIVILNNLKIDTAALQRKMKKLS